MVSSYNITQQSKTLHCSVFKECSAVDEMFQDMVSVPGKITAMENWGLSMYNRQAEASIQRGDISSLSQQGSTSSGRVDWGC